MKSFSVFFATAFLLAAPAKSREIELFSLEQRLLPYADVENASATEIQPEYTRARMAFPPVRFQERQGLLAPSLSYENLHFNYRNWGAIGDASRIDTLHSVQISLFYTQPLRRPNWAIRTFLASGLSSDFASVGWAAFRARGGVIFERTKNNQQIGVGIVVVDNYGRTMPFPALSYEALVRQKHRFSMRAPTQVSWFYVPNDRWEAGLALRINGGNYRLEEPGLYKGKTARYSIGTLGPSVLMKMGPRLAVSLDVGTVFRHKFGVYDDRKEFRDYDLKRSYFASAGIRLYMSRQ